MFFTTEHITTGYTFYGGPTVAASLTGGGNLTTAGSVNCISLSTTGNATINGTLNVTVALTTTAFYANKPWIGVSYTGSIVPAGSPVLCQSGLSLNNSITGIYTFTIPTHPKGINYLVFVQQITASASTALALYGTNVVSATSLTVYSKTYLNAAVASNFYVYTVP